jgi:hypothetical protein
MNSSESRWPSQEPAAAQNASSPLPLLWSFSSSFRRRRRRHNDLLSAVITDDKRFIEVIGLPGDAQEVVDAPVSMVEALSFAMTNCSILRPRLDPANNGA